ncbi:MAG: signal peptidase II [Thermodesulfovibrio sp.]|nr:signal peptidase II [Thermodesulfovibrio sp.]
MSSNLLKGLILVIFLLIFDQVTKYLAIKFLAPDGIVRLLPFLNLVYVENTGTAFGLFKFLGSGFFIFISLLITACLFFMYLKDLDNWFIYSPIIAGALGNITDRVVHGYVIDFIDLHLKNFHWPAFNIADLSISIGLIFFLYRNLKK